MLSINNAYKLYSETSTYYTCKNKFSTFQKNISTPLKLKKWYFLVNSISYSKEMQGKSHFLIYEEGLIYVNSFELPLDDNFGIDSSSFLTIGGDKWLKNHFEISIFEAKFYYEDFISYNIIRKYCKKCHLSCEQCRYGDDIIECTQCKNPNHFLEFTKLEKVSSRCIENCPIGRYGFY